MHNGATKRTRKRNTAKIWRDTVPQLVNSSLTNFFGTNQPMNKQVKKPPRGRNICPVTKSKTSNNGFPAISSPLPWPHDQEQTAPMTVHTTVTIMAPFLREMCISS